MGKEHEKKNRIYSAFRLALGTACAATAIAQAEPDRTKPSITEPKHPNSPMSDVRNATPSAKAASRPNIIFILADDLGIGNVSCYGADNFKTPNIDKLAKSGIRFEHCYAAPLSGPTRALLMTGRYAFRTGMTGNDSGPLLKPANETMMPKVLKPAGYVTAMCGKWSQLPLQPSDFGFDEYLRFKGSGKYWNTQAGNKTYTVNGKETPLLDGEYLPDTMQKFVVDFITRHKDQPFYVYYAMSHVHSEILRTPDSKPDSNDFYTDNVVYMDKLVGKLVAELERLKLRKNTLIVFAGDNGTVAKETPRSTVHGKVLSGSKGTMLECGALVPCITSWPAKTPAGKVSQSLIDLSDFLPTLAEVAGAKLPAGVTIDGKGFAPQLRGQSEVWPRSWIFVELGRHWYDREVDWKLNEAGELFDMSDAPFKEKNVASETSDTNAIAARKRLQAVLDQLNPAGGIVDTGDGSGRHAKNAARDARKAARKNASQNSGNTNAEGE
ncbi:MAG: sulfatase-like hydrolase/transferase [Phycisphaerae bacterium]|nr:sulfatase-like hydrolase/transferase [Phycisphaerae bacterium]